MQLLSLIWIGMKFFFFIYPRTAWRAALRFERGIRDFSEQADRVDAKLPPQLTINDPTVREAEKIVDRFLRREAKRRRK